jgi:hypothetical protein
MDDKHGIYFVPFQQKLLGFEISISKESFWKIFSFFKFHTKSFKKIWSSHSNFLLQSEKNMYSFELEKERRKVNSNKGDYYDKIICS